MSIHDWVAQYFHFDPHFKDISALLTNHCQYIISEWHLKLILKSTFSGAQQIYLPSCPLIAHNCSVIGCLCWLITRIAALPHYLAIWNIQLVIIKTSKYFFSPHEICMLRPVFHRWLQNVGQMQHLCSTAVSSPHICLAVQEVSVWGPKREQPLPLLTLFYSACCLSRTVQGRVLKSESEETKFKKVRSVFGNGFFEGWEVLSVWTEFYIFLSGQTGSEASYWMFLLNNLIYKYISNFT